MTAQFSEKFINNHQDVNFDGFNLYSVSLSKPMDYKNWVGYSFKQKATSKKLNVFTACWRGYISVFELSESGELILIRFEYPALTFEISTEPDSVYEKLQGDFWLEFRAGFFGEKLFVPFIEGKIVTDKNKWISDKENLTSQLTRTKNSWFCSFVAHF